MIWALLMLGDPSIASNLKLDEQVIFFPTLGQPTDDGGWRLHIHGWVFEPEENSSSRRLLIESFRKSLALDREDEASAIFRHRAAPFVVDNERDKQIVIQIGDHRFPLSATGPNGHFDDHVLLSPEQARPLIDPDVPTWIKFHAVLGPSDSRRFDGAALLLPHVGTSVVSDIDDTIKISEVLEKRKLLANTFLNPFRPVDGMAELYTRWAKAGATFHYVSASPWHLYGPLAEFVQEFGFPEGVFQLIHFHWKDESFFNLMAKAKAKKMPAIESLLQAWPQRRFVLIGDSGESDPEIYGEIARKFPDQVVGIFIRDVTAEGRSSPRMKQAFDHIPAGRWTVFADAAELADGPLP